MNSFLICSSIVVFLLLVVVVVVMVVVVILVVVLAAAYPSRFQEAVGLRPPGFDHAALPAPAR